MPEKVIKKKMDKVGEEEAEADTYHKRKNKSLEQYFEAYKRNLGIDSNKLVLTRTAEEICDEVFLEETNSEDILDRLHQIVAMYDDTRCPVKDKANL